MTRYSIEPKDQTFVNVHGFLSYATNMSKNISKNIHKNLNGKFSQNRLDHEKQSATDALKSNKSLQNFITEWFRESCK